MKVTKPSVRRCRRCPNFLSNEGVKNGAHICYGCAQLDDNLKAINLPLPNQEPVERVVEMFMESQDWEGLAKAWQEADIKWHAKEWKEFIEKIKALSRAEVLEEIRGKIEQLLKESENGSALHECSQEGYEYGLEDARDSINTLSDTLAVVDELEGKK